MQFRANQIIVVRGASDARIDSTLGAEVFTTPRETKVTSAADSEPDNPLPRSRVTSSFARLGEIPLRRIRQSRFAQRRPHEWHLLGLNSFEQFEFGFAPWLGEERIFLLSAL